MNVDEAPWYEGERRQRHHEVIIAVLREQIRNDVRSGYITLGAMDKQIESALYAADKLYPPPKPFDHALVSELLKEQEK